MDGFDHDGVRAAFSIPDRFWIPLLMAVGHAQARRDRGPAQMALRRPTTSSINLPALNHFGDQTMHASRPVSTRSTLALLLARPGPVNGRRPSRRRRGRNGGFARQTRAAGHPRTGAGPLTTRPHTSATFWIRHMLAPVAGRFDVDRRHHRHSGQMEPDKGHGHFHRVKTASVDTGVAARDKHLRTAEFFDVAAYPKMTFVERAGSPRPARTSATTSRASSPSRT